MMARFYGWTDEYIDNLPSPKFESYWLGIEVVESREAMIFMEGVTYPHLDKREDRKKMFSSKQRIFKAGFESPRGKVLSYKEVAQNLARKLRGG